MKRKAIVPLVLGLVVGVFTVKLAVDAIQRAQASSKTQEKIRAVRARQDIEPLAEITTEMVEEIETTDSAFAPANERIESLEDVVGRVTAKGIPERTPILKSMLAEEGTQPGMRGKIPPGFRAVSVKIDEVTGVAYQLKPGDWVDVIVVMDVATTQNRGKETIAEVLLQRVQVAAIGHTTNAQQNPTTGTKVKPAKSATILVTEEDVPKLHLAGTRGKITLAMRGDDDKTKGPTQTASLTDILNQFEGKSKDGKKANDSDPVKPIRKRPSWLPEGQEEGMPHAVLVFHGNIGQGNNRVNVEQITFESKDSPKIVGVSNGMPSRSAMDRKAGANRQSQRTGWGGSGSPFNDVAGSDDNSQDDS